MSNEVLFKNYGDYWHFARCFSNKQRKLIYLNFSSRQKKILDKSYINDGWNDLDNRNEIDEKLNSVQLDYNYNLIDIRLKVLKGEKFYMKYNEWIDINKKFSRFKREDLHFIFGNISHEMCDKKDGMVLIKKEK